MLNLPCTSTEQIQALAQCRFLAKPIPAVHRHHPRRNFTARTSSGTYKSPVLAIVSDRSASRVKEAVEAGTFADQLRLGSLMEDGLSYKEKFIVRSYEIEE